MVWVVILRLGQIISGTNSYNHFRLTSYPIPKGAEEFNKKNLHFLSGQGQNKINILTAPLISELHKLKKKG